MTRFLLSRLLFVAVLFGPATYCASFPVEHNPDTNPDIVSGYAPAPTPNVGIPTEAPCSITGPAEALPGRQFVLAFTFPKDAQVEIVFSKEKLDAFLTPDQSAGAFVAPEEGDYDFAVIAKTTVTHELVKLPDGTIANLELVTRRTKTECATLTVRVGKPKPPVPLIELAGEDAADLAEIYRASLNGLPLADSFADYAGALARLLGDLSKNPAVPVIDARLSKAAESQDWKAAVAAAVAGAVKELGPAPEPKPPGPNPIPVAGWHVLLVAETDAPQSISEGQREVLFSTAIRDFVKSKGGDWRKYDPDTTPLIPWAKDAMTRPRASVPWWVYSNGKVGGEGPLPESEAKALEILKGLGG